MMVKSVYSSTFPQMHTIIHVLRINICIKLMNLRNKSWKTFILLTGRLITFWHQLSPMPFTLLLYWGMVYGRFMIIGDDYVKESSSLSWKEKNSTHKSSIPHNARKFVLYLRIQFRDFNRLRILKGSVFFAKKWFSNIYLV